MHGLSCEVERSGSNLDNYISHRMWSIELASQIAVQHIKPIQQAAQVIDFLCHRRVGNEVPGKQSITGQQVSSVLVMTLRFEVSTVDF